MLFEHVAGMVGAMTDDQHEHRHQHGHGNGQHGAGDVDFADMADLLDLDAEVLHGYLSDAVGWVHDQAAGHARRRILDLGCGTGGAALALAQRLAAADVIAMDISADLLDRVRSKAESLGLADRVHPVEADLDRPWPVIDPVDIAWSSMALHHLADPGQALLKILALLRPGGLIAVAEMSSHVRFLPDDVGVGQPGLEQRCLAVLGEIRRATLPYLGADWGAMLAEAGFTGGAERTFEIDLAAPLPPSAGVYAQGFLRRLRRHLADALDAGDLAALDCILEDEGPGGVLHRPDLRIRGTRTVWTARRP